MPIVDTVDGVYDPVSNLDRIHVFEVRKKRKTENVLNAGLNLTKMGVNLRVNLRNLR